MDPKRWDKAVEIELGRTGQIRRVTSTQEAAEILLTKWPIKGGRMHLAARLACLDVLEGVQPPEYAREAFIAAADEAGFLFRSK